MTVSKAGPEGYEHQYRVSAVVAIALWDSLRSGFIEPEEGEDARLTIATSTTDLTLDLQVKRGQGDLDLEWLAEVLTHFPPKKDAHCLLERLESSDVLAVLVCGGSAIDAIRPLVTKISDLPGAGLGAESLRDQDLTDLLKKVGDSHALSLKSKPSGKASDLGTRRAAHCRALSTTWTIERLRLALRRVRIVDRVSPETVAQLAEGLLVRQQRIPGAVAASVLEELRHAVERARSKNEDVRPLLAATIERHQVSRMFQFAVDEPPPARTKMLEALRRDGAILVTGESLVGKTHTALWLAQQLQDEGAHCLLTSDPAEAERHLLSTALEVRVAVLDDPIGVMTLLADAASRWTATTRIARASRAQRCLIVTSRSDLLRLHLGERGYREGLGTGEPHVIEAAETGFVQRVWGAHAKHAGVEATIESRVAQGLGGMDARHLLRPGQLAHLARQPLTSLAGYSFQDACAAARYDAKELGRALARDPDTQRILAALAITTTTIVPVDRRALGFVLSKSAGAPGGCEAVPRAVISLQGRARRKSRFPRYPKRTALTIEDGQILDELERRGLIRPVDKGYVFAHPTYQLAAEQALLDLPSNALAQVVQCLRRAIFCLDRRTAISAVNAAHRLRPTLGDATALLLLAARTSIFPGVRDAALVPLLRGEQVLSEVDVKVLEEAAGNLYQLRTTVRWRKGQAIYDTRKARSAFAALRPVSKRMPKALARAQEANAALPEGQRLTDKDLWLLLDHDEESAQQPSVKLLSMSLSSDEALLRAKAAQIAWDHVASVPLQILEQVSLDPHPVVIAEAVGALMRSWDSTQEDSGLASLAASLTARAADRVIACIAIRFLSHFEEIGGWYDDQQAPWAAWASLALPTLRGLRGHHFVLEPQLYGATEDALSRLPPETALEIGEAWLDWIGRALKERLPEEFGLGLGLHVIRATITRPVRRRQFIKLLLDQTDSHLRVVAIKDLVDEWEHLDSEERTLVLNAIDRPAADRVWARAVSLTRDHAPAEVQMRSLAEGGLLAQPADVILARIDRELLEACLHVHFGSQPFWWLGVHHAKGPWASVVREVSTRPSDSMFAHAWQERLGRVNPNDPTSFEEVLLDWARLCGTASSETLVVLFEVLLRQTVAHNRNPLGPFIDALTTAKLAPLGAWAERVADTLEALDVQKNGHWFLLHAELGVAARQRFLADVGFLRLFQGSQAPPSRQELLERIRTLLPGVRLFTTVDLMDRVTRKVGGPGDDLLDAIAARRTEVLSHGRRCHERLVSREDVAPIEGRWVCTKRSASGPPISEESADGNR